jgi:hypothetical protein
MKRTLSTLILGSLMLLPGCSSHHQGPPVVVRIFRDRNGPAAKRLDATILSIGAQNLKVANGQPIIIATMELTSDSATLTRLGKDVRPEIIILDSSSNWRPADFGPPSPGPICPAGSSCVSGIPRWVQGKEREAAGVVIDAMHKEIQRQN